MWYLDCWIKWYIIVHFPISIKPAILHSKRLEVAYSLNQLFREHSSPHTFTSTDVMLITF